MWALLPLATPGLGAKNASSGGCSRRPITGRGAPTAWASFPQLPRSSLFLSFFLSLFTALYCSFSPTPDSIPPTLSDPCSLVLLLSFILLFFSFLSFRPGYILLSAISFRCITSYTLYTTSGYPELPDWQTLHIILLCPIEKGPVL